MTRPIGYYVHHQGEGHLQRALAIERSAPGAFVLLGTGLKARDLGENVVDLPDDRMGGLFDGQDRQDRPDALHYAPIDHEGIRRRVAAITAWIARVRPALLVVDVSVEVAMLARLASTPTVYVRLGGRRLDAGHLDAFRGAAALMAPFASALEGEDTPQDIRNRTFYAPGVVASPRKHPIAQAQGVILGVVGRGGAIGDGEQWAAAAHAVPNAVWQVIGPYTAPCAPPPNLQFLGWVDDAADRIAAAEVVVGGCGDGLVGAVIGGRRPFVCLPEPRPFDEQHAKARRLGALGAAVVLPSWPAPCEWPGVIARARRLDPAVLGTLDALDGAQRAARWLIDVASRTTKTLARTS